MASKSAMAYREAVEQGLPIGSGHGGHGAGESSDHSGMTMPEDTAPPEHGDAEAEEPPAKASDRSASAAGTHHSEPAGGAAMSGVDHSQPVGGNPGTVTEMTGMDHSQPAGAAADPMAGMDHAAMGHGSPVTIPQSRPSPTSSSQIGQLDPSETLSPDEFDRTVAAPADGATGGRDTEHQGHGAPSPAPSRDSASSKIEPAPDPAEAAFSCPMHPEVRSSQPGTCPKCGMTLVRKER